MPFDHGTFTLAVFSLRDALPDEPEQAFANYQAGPLDNVELDEPQVGWVTGRYLLENNIDSNNAWSGGCLNLAYRKAERKVPAALLNAICRREELVYMLAHKSTFVPRKEKKQIKEQVLETYSMKIPPAISGVPFVIDPAAKMVYVATSSQAQHDEIVSLMYKTIGQEPLAWNPGWLLEEALQKTESSCPTLNFCAAAVSDGEMTIGRDFLTWLWYFNEEGEGKVEHPQYGEFEVLVEGPLSFALSSEARGAGEITLKKGECPSRSAEAQAALNVGKKLKKAKVSITRGNDVWSFTFDADRFTFGSMSLPEGEELEQESRFAERMQNILVFTEAWKLFFVKFAEMLYAPDFEEQQKQILKWAEVRDGF